MPLYLVRWPDLSAALVKARDEADLEDKLDQVDNPEGCTWSVYKGPVFIDFQVPVKFSVDRHEEDPNPVGPDQIEVEDVSQLEQRTLDLDIPVADEGSDMIGAILKGAFPHLYEIWKEGHDVFPEAEFREAVVKELGVFVRNSWRAANIDRRSDPAAFLAQQMGTSIAQAERLIEETQRREREGTPPKKPSK